MVIEWRGFIKLMTLLETLIAEYYKVPRVKLTPWFSMEEPKKKLGYIIHRHIEGNRWHQDVSITYAEIERMINNVYNE